MTKAQSKVLTVYLFVICLVVDMIIIVYIFHGLLFTKENLGIKQIKYQITDDDLQKLKKTTLPDINSNWDNLKTEVPFDKAEDFIESVKKIIDEQQYTKYGEIIQKLSEKTNIKLVSCSKVLMI
ncbi:MAG: hypothetical protein MUC94_02820 [bacterium]|nr:hypothetical protein [bacterium]